MKAFPWKAAWLREFKLRAEALKALGFESYKSYLCSELWLSIKAKLLPAKCQRCGRGATELHHTNYRLETLSGADLSGLVPVCRGHHRHATKKQMRSQRTRRQRRTLAAQGFKIFVDKKRRGA